MKHVRRLRRLAKAARRRLRARSKWIGERLAYEPGYAEALASLAITAAELLLRGHRVRRLVAGAAQVFVVITHSLMRRQDGDDPQHLWA